MRVAKSVNRVCIFIAQLVSLFILIILLISFVGINISVTNSLHIRLANSEDALTLAELGARTFRDTFGDDNDPKDLQHYIQTAFNAEQTRVELSNSDTIFLLGIEGGMPVGYAKLHVGRHSEPVKSKNPVEMSRLYVDRSAIGKGYGTALMRRCIDEGRRGGHDKMWLGVWEKNPRAIGFYKKFGFRTVGSHTFMLGYDSQKDWIMERSI